MVVWQPSKDTFNLTQGLYLRKFKKNDLKCEFLFTK